MSIETLTPFIANPEFAAAADTVRGVFGKLFSRFHWTSLLSATLIAFGVWAWRARSEPAVRAQGFLGFLFPRDVWLHRSALLDYRFVLFDKVALGVLVGLVAILASPQHVEAVAKGGRWAADNAAQASLSVVIAYTVALLFAEDFFRYWAHRLMHWSPFLWQFHKVHHSSETLVPVSQLRNHPVNGLVNLGRSLIAVPIVTGAFLIAFPGQLTVMSILGINAGRFAFDMLGAQLRHSHIWVAFPQWLSRLVISPAMHQIHHSRAEKHWDRNFGSQFALWDWLFGTIYVPKEREDLSFGIDKRDTERMRTVASLYIVPFKDAWNVVRARRRDKAIVARRSKPPLRELTRRHAA
ncbi:MAG: sterol desaturase family protein [Sphingomonas sp.]|nr:sterol desaturase family protein [Sphingomonas sp.]